jgi:predicted negative regulator of RcsB-dependent stress response
VQDAYPELIEMLYHQNELEEAKIWMERAEKEGIKPASIAFLRGLVSAKEGNHEAAIASFTKARDLDETLSQSAELQIALAQVRAKRFREAAERLRTVITINPTSDLASFAKDYEIALVQRRERHKAWLFTLGAAYQYDDNVVLKPTEAIPGVKISHEEDSSAVGELKVEYRPYLEGAWTLSGQYGFYGNIHSRLHSYDLMVQSLSLIPGYDFGTHAVTLPLAYNHVWLRRHEYMSLASAKPTLNMVLGTGGQIGQLSFGYSMRDLLQRPLMEEEDRNGNIFSLSIGFLSPLRADRGTLNFRYELVGEDTQGKNWENTGHRFGAGFLIPIWKNINLIGSGEAFLQYYENKHTVFGKTRRDYTYAASAAINWRDLYPGLNLNVEYSYSRDDSNIAIYDYKRNMYTVGLEYRF